MVVAFKAKEELITGLEAPQVEYRRAEEALPVSKELYRLLLENSGSAITFYDSEGRCILLNRQAADCLGGKPEDFIGKTIHDMLPGTGDYYLQRFAKILNEGEGAGSSLTFNP